MVSEMQSIPPDTPPVIQTLARPSEAERQGEAVRIATATFAMVAIDENVKARALA